MNAASLESQVRVAIIENSRMGVQLLAEALSHHGIAIVASASNSRDFLSAVSGAEFDVAVIGSTVDAEPGKGFQLLRTLRELRPFVSAVMLMEACSREFVVEAFRAGARGIFSRQDSLDSLRKCVECVHAGQIWANREELTFALEALRTTPSVCGIRTKALATLSNRENDVIQCLAEGLTNREIGQRLHLSPHTVKNYLFRIFDKVGVSSRVELLFLILSRPNGTDHDTERADSLSECMKAAAAGSPGAQLRLARYYREGDGVPKDLLQAYKWLLVCENSMREMAEKIRNGKMIASSGMLDSEISEAERRASEWLRASGKPDARPFKVPSVPTVRTSEKRSLA